MCGRERGSTALNGEEENPLDEPCPLEWARRRRGVGVGSSSGGGGNAGSTSVDAGSIFDTLADIAVDHIARLVTLREGLVHQVTPDQLADMDEKFNAAVQRIRAEIPARNHTLWSDPNCPYPALHDVESEGEQDDESEAMEEARGGADHHTGW